MDGTEVSHMTRRGMIFIGLLQGTLCYLLMAYLAPHNDGWLFYGMPATIAITSTLLLTIVSFKQRALWYWMALIFATVLAMCVWLEWRVKDSDKRRQHEVFMFYGWRLLLTAMLALLRIQHSLHVSREQARYPHFYRQLWLNVLTLLIISVTNGLFWLMLLLWGKMFRLVSIPFFNTLFFDTDWLGHVTFGPIAAPAVVPARTQLRLVMVARELLTFITTGLLPLVALLALMFMLTSPFTGLEAISQRVSAAGLMSMLTLFLLLLMTIMREPQKEALLHPGALCYLIKCSLTIAPIYVLITDWSLQVRIQKCGWMPGRLYGVLVAMILLVWPFDYLASTLRHGCNPLELQGPVILGVSLLMLRLLVLLSSPVTDAWCISVNNHMGPCHSGKIEPDQVSLYMLDHNGKPGRAALEALQKDVAFNQGSKRRHGLNSLLQGCQDPVKEPIATQLVSEVVMVPENQKPDGTFWASVKTQGYYITSYAEQNACVLVDQDLNADGHPKQVLYALGDGESLVFDMQKNKWDLLVVVRLPEGFIKDRLLQAMADRQLGLAPRTWRDITIDGKRLLMTYHTE